MSITTTETRLPTRAVGTRTAVTAAGVVAALACAGYISGFVFMSDLSTAEAVRAPVTVAECLLAGTAYLVIAITLGGLAQVTALPRWTLTLAAAGCGLIAIQAWMYGTIAADLARLLPEQQFEQMPDQAVLMQLLYLPMGVVCLVGFAALAVVGWRRRALPKGVCALLVVAGLASLLGPFPPVGLLGGLALCWLARAAKSAQIH